MCLHSVPPTEAPPTDSLVIDITDPGQPNIHPAQSHPADIDDFEIESSPVGNPETPEAEPITSTSADLPVVSPELVKPVRPVSGERYSRVTVRPALWLPYGTHPLSSPPTRSPATPRPPPEPPPRRQDQRVRAANP